MFLARFSNSSILFPIIYLLIIIIITIKCEHDESVRIETPLGIIEGESRKSHHGRTFFSFQGVPYGKPPIAGNRFKQPEIIEPWSHVWVAKTNIECMQYYQNPPDIPGDWIIGDEDCLYLNIFTPILDPKANLDVIVYIHGGGFMFHHAGPQDPDYIMDRDVIYVNLRYRQGPLGFLSTEDSTVPGNNGIKDQILALKWIQKYISHFGGNPHSVTITGMSAGGASVHTHFLAPESRDLFHTGISQSGTTLNPWVFMEAPLAKTLKIASLVGCPTQLAIGEVVDCLRTRPARQIVQSVKQFQPWFSMPFSPFGLVVDANWTQNPVFPDTPYNLIRNGKVSDKPWIVSHTASEGLFPAADFYHDRFIADINQRWDELIPLVLDYRSIAIYKIMSVD